jgi:hypothetical protein
MRRWRAAASGGDAGGVEWRAHHHHHHNNNNNHHRHRHHHHHHQEPKKELRTQERTRHTQEPCTPKNQELRTREPKNWPQKNSPAHHARCPAHLFWRPTAHQEPKKELRTQERTRHTQELRTKNETPRTFPENSPAHLAPHTFTGARKGVLETVAAVRTRRRHVSYLVTGPGSRHGLGAQPGIRSLADPCNGFQPG